MNPVNSRRNANISSNDTSSQNRRSQLASPNFDTLVEAAIGTVNDRPQQTARVPQITSVVPHSLSSLDHLIAIATGSLSSTSSSSSTSYSSTPSSSSSSAASRIQSSSSTQSSLSSSSTPTNVVSEDKKRQRDENTSNANSNNKTTRKKTSKSTSVQVAPIVNQSSSSLFSSSSSSSSLSNPQFNPQPVTSSSSFPSFNTPQPASTSSSSSLLNRVVSQPTHSSLDTTVNYGFNNLYPSPQYYPYTYTSSPSPLFTPMLQPSQYYPYTSFTSPMSTPMLQPPQYYPNFSSPSPISTAPMLQQVKPKRLGFNVLHTDPSLVPLKISLKAPPKINQSNPQASSSSSSSLSVSSSESSSKMQESVLNSHGLNLGFNFVSELSNDSSENPNTLNLMIKPRVLPPATRSKLFELYNKSRLLIKSDLVASKNEGLQKVKQVHAELLNYSDCLTPDEQLLFVRACFLAGENLPPDLAIEVLKDGLNVNSKRFDILMFQLKIYIEIGKIHSKNPAEGSRSLSIQAYRNGLSLLGTCPFEGSIPNKIELHYSLANVLQSGGTAEELNESVQHYLLALAELRKTSNPRQEAEILIEMSISLKNTNNVVNIKAAISILNQLSESLSTRIVNCSAKAALQTKIQSISAACYVQLLSLQGIGAQEACAAVKEVQKNTQKS